MTNKQDNLRQNDGRYTTLVLTQIGAHKGPETTTLGAARRLGL